MEPPKEIRNCKILFQCPKLWKRLAETADPKVRFCDQCFEQVYLVQTEEELADQSARGRCVAILNLSPEHPAYTDGMMVGEVLPDWSEFDEFKKDDNGKA